MGVDSILTGVPQGANIELIATGVCTFTKAANSTGGSGIVTHNLGYRPLVIAGYDTGGGADGSLTIWPESQSVDSGSDAGKLYANSRIAVTTSVVEFQIETPNLAGGNPSYTSEQTYNIRYYLLRSTGQSN